MDTRQSTTFLCKKWTLFTLCLSVIVVTIVLAALASSIIDNYVDNHNYGNFYTRSQLDSIKSTAKTFIYVAVVFAILFQLLGVVGVYKEHYCMTLTYTILMTLSALVSIGNSVSIPTFWFNTALDFVIVILGYIFVFDLRRIRQEQFTSRVFVTNPAPTNTHVHIQGPSTVYSGQYDQTYANTTSYNQQYQSSQYTNSQNGWNTAPPPPPYQNEKGAIP